MISTNITGASPIGVRHVFSETGEALDQLSTTPLTASAVSSIMTRVVYCVRREVSVELLAMLFLEHGVSGFPVVDELGHPVGVVSKTDLLRHVHEHGVDSDEIRPEEAAILAQLGGGFHAVATDGTTVEHVMTPIVFAVAHDAPIARAAALMAGEGVHRIPILDDEGTVCGILSALDIVRWLATLGGYPVR